MSHSCAAYVDTHNSGTRTHARMYTHARTHARTQTRGDEALRLIFNKTIPGSYKKEATVLSQSAIQSAILCQRSAILSPLRGYLCQASSRLRTRQSPHERRTWRSACCRRISSSCARSSCSRPSTTVSSRMTAASASSISAVRRASSRRRRCSSATCRRQCGIDQQASAPRGTCILQES